MADEAVREMPMWSGDEDLFLMKLAVTELTEESSELFAPGESKLCALPGR